jgi:hypothetical protein
VLKHRPILHVPRPTFYARGTWDVEREPIATAYNDFPRALILQKGDRQ